MKKRIFTAVSLAVTLLAIGCVGKLEAPPVEITYRSSLLGAGNIVRVENKAGEALQELKVTIRTESSEATYEQTSLSAQEVLEVGWKKLNGFEIPDGANVEVRAQGYALAARAQLTTSAKTDGGSSS